MTKGIGNAQKRTSRRKYECLYPSCSETAIKSHSQQRLGALRAISENGSVYSIQKNQYQVLKGLPDPPLMVRTGISAASTFDGFCSYHDRTLFKPLETRPLKVENRGQAVLLLLRTFCYEFATQRRVRDWTSILIDEVRDIADSEFLEYIDQTRIARDIFIRRDGPYYFSVLFGVIEERSYEKVCMTWKAIDKNVGLSCCCIFSPLLENHDDYMKKHWDEPQPLVNFNLVPESGQTHVVAVWLDDVEALCQWIRDEVKDDDRLEAFINKCAFEESEDTCVRPSLWESLSPADRKSVELAMMPVYMRGPVEPVRAIRI